MRRYATLKAKKLNGTAIPIRMIRHAMQTCRQRAKRDGMCARFYGRIKHKRAIFNMVRHPYLVGRSNYNSIYSLKHPAALYCYEWAVYFTESRAKKYTTTYSRVADGVWVLREKAIQHGDVATDTVHEIDTRLPIQLEERTLSPYGEIYLDLMDGQAVPPRSPRRHRPTPIEIELLREEISKLRAENDALRKEFRNMHIERNKHSFLCHCGRSSL